MSATLDLVKSLTADGVEFSTDGWRIHWRNGDGKMAPEIVATLAAAKATVIDFLSGRNSPAGDDVFSDQYAPAREDVERQAVADGYAEELAADEKPSSRSTTGTDKTRNKPRRHFVEPLRFDPVARPDDLEIYAEALRLHGPMTYGMAIRILGWGYTSGASRDSIAHRRSDQVQHIRQGRVDGG